MDFPISILTKNILKVEYIIRSNILYKLSLHIENLNSKCIIHHSLRSKYALNLNNIIKQLNEEYNGNIRNIKDNKIYLENNGIYFFQKNTFFYKLFKPYYDIIVKNIYDYYIKNNPNGISFDIFEKNVFKNDKTNLLDINSILENVISSTFNFIEKQIVLIKYSNDCEMKKIKEKLAIDNFNEIDKLILNFSNNIGFNNFSDIFILLLGNSYRSILEIDNDNKILNNYLEPYHKDKTNPIYLEDIINKLNNSFCIFDLLSKCFIPIRLVLKNTKVENKGIIIKKKDITSGTIKENSSKFKYEILLDNCYKIIVKIPQLSFNIIFIGYFNYDATNVLVRTSKINYYFLNIKNCLLQKHVDINLQEIDESFKTIYIKNLQIGDILSYDGNSLCDKIEYDYLNIYIKYTSSKFRIIMADFLKSDLLKKYLILKNLLMGNKDSIKYAGLLYALTKDQQRDSKNNYSYLSNILYRNLNYPLQSKLKKSGYYIKDEIERLKELSCEDVDLKKQILISINMPDKIKKIAMNKIEEMKNNNSEYYKYHQYVKCLIDYPWINNKVNDIFSCYKNNIDKSKSLLDDTDKKLNELVYGHIECKKIIKELLAKWIMSDYSKSGKAIGLCGPPGVGKTLIAKGLGEILNIPFTQINVGGMDDGSVLSGHSITYSGSQYGLIVRKMCEAGKSRCIMFFDELDKSCTRHGVNEIYNILIHVTDPNTNHEFNDKYFQEVQFPLSNVVFIFSFNDRSKVDKILLDRMEVINVESYSVHDKLKIAKQFLIKIVLKEFNIENESIILSDESLIYLIEEYTYEAGVRNLKRKIESIYSKINIDRIYKNGLFKSIDKISKENQVIINKQDIVKYLSKPIISIKKIHNSHQIGILSGLYATTIGIGGIIPIVIYPNLISNKNSFNLRLTGSQGKVMKESVVYAFTIAIHSIKTNFRSLFFKNYVTGLHIHTPDGSTPKDGPSAGSAFTTAFISRILNKHVKKDVAFTGEIEINGNITQIGGLECKLNGAKKAGVKLVFCPKENIDDIIKIKKYNPNLFKIWNPEKNREIKKIIIDCEKYIKENKNNEDNSLIFSENKDFRILIVSNIKEVVKYALIDNLQQVKKNYNVYKSYFNTEKYFVNIINQTDIKIDTDDIIEDSNESDTETSEEIS